MWARRYGLHTLLTQLGVPPAHGVHAAVHLALLLSAAQVLSGHMWKVALQVGTHPSVLPLHATLPLVGATQVTHAVPHAAGLLLSTQVGAAGVPRLQKPG